MNEVYKSPSQISDTPLVSAGRCAEAVDVAMSAVSVEPLRDSAQRALLAAHLAEGNIAEGQRCFAVYRDLLRRELGVEPPKDHIVAAACAGDRGR